MKNTLLTILFALCVLASVSGQITAIKPTTPEQSGDEMAAVGKYPAAIDQYKTAWLGWMTGRNEADAELRSAHERLAGKMGATLAKMASPPVPSEDADFHFQKGLAFIKLAKTPLDFLKAATQFQEAVNGAPWFFDYHFNLAVAYKSAGQFRDALYALSLAKLLAANEKDRRDANALRAEIEAASEIADSSKALADKTAAEENLWKQFVGTWSRSATDGGGTSHIIRTTIERLSENQWKFTEGMDAWAGNEMQGIHDVRVTNGRLHFLHDDLIIYPDGPIKCGVYDTTVTVSADGSRLTWDRRTTPLSSDRSNRCTLPKYFASAVWEFRRER